MNSHDERMTRIERLERADHNAVKAAAREAIREFLDDQFAMFGKWSMRVLAAVILSALVYFVLSMSGWHR